MNFTRVGDLAQHMLLKRQNTALKTQLGDLTRELASGRKSDVAKSLSGDFGLLGSVERSLNLLNGFDVATSDARLFSDTVQATLDTMQTMSGDLAAAAISVASAGLQTPVDSVIAEADQDFRTMVAALNSDVAGRSLFAGAATDSAALMDADMMLTDLSAAVAGALTVSDIVQAVEDWFMAPGGGFETTAYLGSTTDLAPFRLSEDDSVRHALRADSTELRAMLRDTALVALAGDAGLALDLTEKKQLIHATGESLLAQQEGLTRIRADLGFVQERIDAARAQNATQRSSLEIVRNDLVAADPFETATRLEALQIQLESLYTVTARFSQLSLMDYMR